MANYDRKSALIILLSSIIFGLLYYIISKNDVSPNTQTIIDERAITYLGSTSISFISQGEHVYKKSLSTTNISYYVKNKDEVFFDEVLIISNHLKYHGLVLNGTTINCDIGKCSINCKEENKTVIDNSKAYLNMKAIFKSFGANSTYFSFVPQGEYQMLKLIEAYNITYYIKNNTLPDEKWVISKYNKFLKNELNRILTNCFEEDTEIYQFECDELFKHRRLTKYKRINYCVPDEFKDQLEKFNDARIEEQKLNYYKTQCECVKERKSTLEAELKIRKLEKLDSTDLEILRNRLDFSACRLYDEFLK